MLVKSQKIAFAFGAWALVTLAILSVFNALDYEFFFILCLIGFLIIVELFGPFTSQPRWRSRTNVIIAIGVILFAYIMAMKVLNIVGI